MQELQKEINKIQKNLFNTSEKEAEAAKAEMYKLQDNLKGVQTKKEISLACLLEFSDCTQDRFEDIMKRIMRAFNIDVDNRNSRIDFEKYVRIKCFLQEQTLGFEDKLKLWMDIINDRKCANLTKIELEDLFERFARGKM